MIYVLGQIYPMADLQLGVVHVEEQRNLVVRSWCLTAVVLLVLQTFFLTLALIACVSRDLAKYDLAFKVRPSCHTLRKQHFLIPSICSSNGEEPYHHHQQHEETHGVHFPLLPFPWEENQVYYLYY